MKSARSTRKKQRACVIKVFTLANIHLMYLDIIHRTRTTDFVRLKLRTRVSVQAMIQRFVEQKLKSVQKSALRDL